MADVLTINVATGERTERDFTSEEVEKRAADQAAFEAEVSLKQEQQAAKQAALESGQAKLLALGLTEDEVAAMTSG